MDNKNYKSDNKLPLAIINEEKSMSKKQLVRLNDDRMVAGVASGVARYFNIDATLVRLLFVLLALGGGHGVLLYIILWFAMPEASTEATMNGYDDSQDEEIIIEKSA